MAIKYECDRCEKQFTDSDNLRDVIIQQNTNPSRSIRYGVDPKAYGGSLCEDCIAAVQEVLKTKPPKAI